MTDGELLNRLEEIDEKVDKIQSDVNINTSMHKELNKKELRDQIMTKFGRGDTKKKIWYYAKEKLTIGEFADKTGSTEGYMQNTLPSMDEEGLLNKKKKDGETVYFRNPTTEGIGIENEIEEQIDDL